MSRYERIEIQTRWNRRECEVAIRRLENSIKLAKVRAMNNKRWLERGEPKYSTANIANQIVETREVLRMWQERLREYE